MKFFVLCCFLGIAPFIGITIAKVEKNGNTIEKIEKSISRIESHLDPSKLVEKEHFTITATTNSREICLCCPCGCDDCSCPAAPCECSCENCVCRLGAECPDHTDVHINDRGDKVDSL